MERKLCDVTRSAPRYILNADLDRRNLMDTLHSTRKLLTAVCLMLCILFLAGCNLPPVLTPVPALPTATSPQPAATATPIPPTPTSVPPTATTVPPTPTNLPELPENAATVQVGFLQGGIFYLTYDISLWEAVPVAEEPGAYRLVSLVFPGCEMYQLLGHGMDPNKHQPNQSTEVIGQTTFAITDWIEIPSGKSILYSYFWGSNQEYALEVAPGEQDQDCITLSRQVVALSETLGFSQP